MTRRFQGSGGRAAGANSRRLIASAALTALVLGACSGDPQGNEQDSREIASQDRVAVVRTLTTDLRSVSGALEYRDQADARARIAGVLTSLSVKEGDHVVKDQVIGLVRDDRLGQEARASDAQILAASAEADRARAELARTQDLYDHGVYAKARLEQVEATSRSAAARLTAARAQGAASIALVGQGRIHAPASGIVLRAQIPAGSVVAPGQSIVTITAGAPVVRLRLPEAQASALKVGTSLQLQNGDGATSSAAITEIYPSVTAGVVTIDIAATATPAGLIGRRVDAKVPMGARLTVLLPLRFITSRYGVDYARIVKPDGKAEEVVVQTAPSSEAGKVEILSGLQAGDVVCAPTMRDRR